VNRRAQIIAAWCGPAICVIFSLGALALARFIPPEISPKASAQHAQDILVHHTGRYRVGLTLMLTAMSIMPAWGVVVACQMRTSEGRFPVLAWVQVASIAVGSALACSGCIIWGCAAYRPAGLSPEFSRFGIDLGWHFFLWAWEPFSVWAVAMGMAIIGSDNTVYPRWSAYVSFWTAFLFSAATGLTFVKDGPFAYNGLLTLWMVMSVFFVWIIVTSVLTLQNVKRGQFHTFHDAGTDGPRPDDEIAVRSRDVPAAT